MKEANMNETISIESAMETRNFQIPALWEHANPEYQDEIEDLLLGEKFEAGEQQTSPEAERILQQPHGYPRDLLAQVFGKRDGKDPVKIILEYIWKQDILTPIGFWNTGAAKSLLVEDFLTKKPKEDRDSLLEVHLEGGPTPEQRVFAEYRADQNQFYRHGIELAMQLSGRGYTWRQREELHMQSISGAS